MRGLGGGGGGGEAMAGSVPLVRIGYVTDVEGNLDYFRQFVELSPVVSYDDDGELQLDDDQCFFVFGGDVVDKGPGDPPQPAARNGHRAAEGGAVAHTLTAPVQTECTAPLAVHCCRRR